MIVENKQAIEMTGIYRDIINGTRELMSTVIDNRLNNVMKSLTIITLIMAIPTVISGIYGMNVSSKWVPLATTAHGFMIIIGVMVVICVLILILLKKALLFVISFFTCVHYSRMCKMPQCFIENNEILRLILF